jgi:hypothetical protein
MSLPGAIHSPSELYLARGPARSPHDTVLLNPIVRLASKAPVADRRVKSDGIAVVEQRPVSWRQRRHNLATTPARAEVYDRGVLNTDVEDTSIQVSRHRVNERV